MIHVKPGARVGGLSVEILLALLNARDLYRKHGAELIVTSALDGRHSRGSLHYIGHAADIRTHNLPGGNNGPVANSIAQELRLSLGDDYDVVTEKDHIHVEFQPKVGMNFR